LRFGQHGATIAILLVSGIAIWGTVQGVGPFSLGSRNESLILLQTFLAVVSLTSLILAAATIERNKANKQLHALSQRLMKAQEEERLYLSRELHDGSGQVLAALMMQLGLLERDAEKPEAVHARAVELKHAVNAIQDDLHRLAVNLRPASLDHLGLITALQQFLGEFSRRYGIHVEFETVELHEKRLPIEVETTLFRTVQESLTNVVLHAQATRVDVLLSMQNGRVIAVVEDNGIGFIPISYTMENHLGLFGMRERVEMLGGEFAIESSPGRGTTVRIEVPCND
jgi:signal transduction histidine kinase